jgi:hypothetical protein
LIDRDKIKPTYLVCDGRLNSGDAFFDDEECYNVCEFDDDEETASSTILPH